VVCTSGIASADRQAVSGLFGSGAHWLSRRRARRDAARNQLSVEQDDVISGGR